MTRPDHRSLRADDGMTLVEVLVTIVIGSIVLAAAVELMTGGFASSARVQDRADAAGRARLAVDRVTSLLQAQVCNGTNSPIIQGTATSVRFTANTGDRNAIPTQYQIRYAGGRLYERRWQMNPTPNATTGAYTPTTTSTEVQLADRVEPISVGTPAAPVFRYFRTDDTTTNEQVEMALPLTSSSAALAPPLPPSDRRRVLRVDIDLRVLPTRSSTDAEARRVSSRLQASAYVVSNVDPAQLEKGPKCSTG